MIRELAGSSSDCPSRRPWKSVALARLARARVGKVHRYHLVIKLIIKSKTGIFCRSAVSRILSRMMLDLSPLCKRVFARESASLALSIKSISKYSYTILNHEPEAVQDLVEGWWHLGSISMAWWYSWRAASWLVAIKGSSVQRGSKFISLFMMANKNRCCDFGYELRVYACELVRVDCCQ